MEMKNTKCQNLVIFSLKIRMKHNFLLSINQVSLFYCLHNKSKCILVWFLLEYSNKEVLFRGAALIRGRRLFQCRYAKLEIRYSSTKNRQKTDMWFQVSNY